MWHRGLAPDYEAAHRRVANRSGFAPRNSIDSRWQWYCADSAFSDFGDAYVANSGRPQLDSATLDELHSHTSSIRANAGSTLPLATVPLHPAICSHGTDYPICPDIVDLREPLPACVRRDLNHRIHVLGGAEPFPWWRTCGDSLCEPMPRTFRADVNGTLVPWYLRREDRKAVVKGDGRAAQVQQIRRERKVF